MPTTNDALAAAVAPVLSDIHATTVNASTWNVSHTFTAVTPPSWYAINNREGANDEAEAEILIYDEIGAFGITASQFVRDLGAVTARRIRLRLNTPGGEIFDATAIYNALKGHPAEIIVQVDGVAASAGSFIAMSGDEVRMADNAYLMIHEAHGGVMGDAAEMRTYADALDKCNDNIAGMYAAKAGKTRRHYRSLMAAETWFTAAEAKAEGLADAVDKPAKKPQPAKAAFDFKVYNQAKIPEPVRRLWGLPPTNTTPEAPPVAPPAAPEPTESTAPEVPQRSGPPPANHQETSLMANDSTQAAPAQTPAAPATPNVTQGSSQPTEAEGRRQELVQLNQKAIEQFTEQGRVKGVADGRKLERERAEAMINACPGKPEMAINAILSDQQNPAAVKMAFDATVMAETKARADLDAMQAENDRWRALALIGGHPGVATALGNTEDAQATMEPKARAEWEWDNDPAARKTARTKELYVIARTAELDGTHRSVRPMSA